MKSGKTCKETKFDFKMKKKSLFQVNFRKKLNL